MELFNSAEKISFVLVWEVCLFIFFIYLGHSITEEPVPEALDRQL